ncbi:accessory gene regulator ArgB-like protein [Alkalibaculum bacchi]|uniref:accessory gene regulator ArgB-like protein n=1 Tax=Alkalibaculum bacchi TaxID=645887 RepID=UPI00350E5029
MRMDVFEQITDSFVSNGVIPYEDKDLYTYGLEQGTLMVLNIATTIVIGIVLRMVWQSILLTLVYIPLRTYAGGYHARTQFRCYIFSIGTMSITLLGIKLIPWTSIICLMVALCAGSIVFLFAPVEDSNKPLDRKEIAIYRKKTRVLLSVLFAGALILWLLGQNQISICITVAVALCAVMLVLGKVKNIKVTLKLSW